MNCTETLFSACQLSVEGWCHSNQQLRLQNSLKTFRSISIGNSMKL